jgi:hypothetical protein
MIVRYGYAPVVKFGNPGLHLPVSDHIGPDRLIGYAVLRLVQCDFRMQQWTEQQRENQTAGT